MSKCEITQIECLKKNRPAPVLINFENGKILPGVEDQLECHYASNSSLRKEKLLTVATAANVYSGTVGKGYPDDLTRNFIAVRNKKTNKMRLIEIEQCSMLSCHFDGLVEDGQTKQMKLSKQMARQMLIKKFGSKMSKSNANKVEGMAVNVDILKDELDKTMNETNLDRSIPDKFDQQKVEHEQQMQTMIPQVNLLAKSDAELYRIEDLIKSNLIDRLKNEALAILKTPLESIPTSNKFILNIINGCQQSNEPDSTENILKVKICIILDALINFLTALQVKTNNKIETLSFSQITEKVESYIRREFTEPTTSKFGKSKFNIDKTTCLAIVLGLLVSENYEAHIDIIAETLAVTKTKIKMLCTQMSITKSVTGNLKIAKKRTRKSI